MVILNNSTFQPILEKVTPNSTAERDIRTAGLRCTAQRIAVLDVLRAKRDHLRADEVAQKVGDRLGVVSVQAVYDSLGALVESGLARRILPVGGAALFEARLGDDHHHVVCQRCGTTLDVACVSAEAPCVEPQTAHGFVIHETEVIFRGTCPSCQVLED